MNHPGAGTALYVAKPFRMNALMHESEYKNRYMWGLFLALLVDEDGS